MQKREFPGQSQRRVSPYTSNHGILPVSWPITAPCFHAIHQITEFCQLPGQLQRRVSPYTSNHCILPDDADGVNDSGRPLP